MTTEQEILDLLEQTITKSDRTNDDLLKVLQQGDQNDVTLRDGAIVPSLSKRVKTNTDIIKIELNSSVQNQTTTTLNQFEVDKSNAFDDFQTTTDEAIGELHKAVEDVLDKNYPVATENILGGVKIGTGLSIDNEGHLCSTGLSPLGVAMFHNGSRATIGVGHVAFDGQLLNRADFPVFWETVQKKFTVVTDDLWLASGDSTNVYKNRGCYSSGDGLTTFRMPDFNGVQTGSYKGAFLRGDGGGTIGGVTVSSGTALSDAIRNIGGNFSIASYNDANNSSILSNASSGLFTRYQSYGGLQSALTFDGTQRNGTQVYFDASKVVPTASENRPVSVVGVWICRVGSTEVEVITEPNKHAVLVGGNTFIGTQKMEAVEFSDSSILRGLVNVIDAGGLDKVVSAEAIKLFYQAFTATVGTAGKLIIPNSANPSRPTIIQWTLVNTTAPASATANQIHSFTGNWHTAFPNRCAWVLGVKSNQIIGLATVEGATRTGFNGFAMRYTEAMTYTMSVIGIGD